MLYHATVYQLSDVNLNSKVINISLQNTESIRLFIFCKVRTFWNQNNVIAHFSCILLDVNIKMKQVIICQVIFSWKFPSRVIKEIMMKYKMLLGSEEHLITLITNSSFVLSLIGRYNFPICYPCFLHFLFLGCKAEIICIWVDYFKKEFFLNMPLLEKDYSNKNQGLIATLLSYLE